jgi:hypothetical protein
MNTQTTLPANLVQRAIRSPWAKLILGFLIIFLPVAIEQTFILSLPLTPLLRSILVAAFTVPRQSTGTNPTLFPSCFIPIS